MRISATNPAAHVVNVTITQIGFPTPGFAPESRTDHVFTAAFTIIENLTRGRDTDHFQQWRESCHTRPVQQARNIYVKNSLHYGFITVIDSGRHTNSFAESRYPFAVRSKE